MLARDLSLSACLKLAVSLLAIAPTSIVLAQDGSGYHYEPVPGKIVGLWPDSWSADRLRWLRLQYGFSGVSVAADSIQYANALLAGFASSAIMVGISDENYLYAARALPAGLYYLDEPVEHDCYGHATGHRLYTPAELAARHDTIHARAPNARFAIGGYKRCSHNMIAALYADIVMYSSYENWDELGIPVCHVNMGWGDEWENPWLPGSSDQRGSWSAMRQTYGAKFSMTWIHGGGDEYPELFAHAGALGLSGIWQYNGGPIDTARLESFCEAAWQNGWLARVADVPLPLALVSFTASSTAKGAVHLQWQTLSEQNNYGFQVQRRAPADRGFSDVPNGFVAGHGTTLDRHEYSFLDSPEGGAHWLYRLKQIDLDGSVHFFGPVEVQISPAGANDRGPDSFQLFQNVPNPFNPATTITYEIPTDSRVTLRVYDVLGREVRTLAEETQPRGHYEVRFEGTALGSGTYYCRMRAEPVSKGVGAYTKMLKLLLLK